MFSSVLHKIVFYFFAYCLHGVLIPCPLRCEFFFKLHIRLLSRAPRAIIFFLKNSELHGTRGLPPNSHKRFHKGNRKFYQPLLTFSHFLYSGTRSKMTETRIFQSFRDLETMEVEERSFSIDEDSQDSGISCDSFNESLFVSTSATNFSCLLNKPSPDLPENYGRHLDEVEVAADNVLKSWAKGSRGLKTPLKDVTNIRYVADTLLSSRTVRFTRTQELWQICPVSIGSVRDCLSRFAMKYMKLFQKK